MHVINQRIEIWYHLTLDVRLWNYTQKCSLFFNILIANNKRERGDSWEKTFPSHSLFNSHMQHVIRSSGIHHTIIYSYHTIYESEITNHFVPGVPVFSTHINPFNDTERIHCLQILKVINMTGRHTDIFIEYHIFVLRHEKDAWSPLLTLKGNSICIFQRL